MNDASDASKIYRQTSDAGSQVRRGKTLDQLFAEARGEARLEALREIREFCNVGADLATKDTEQNIYRHISANIFRMIRAMTQGSDV